MKQTEKSQIDKFEAASRALETDETQEHFDAVLKRVAKAPKPSAAPVKKP